MEGVVKLDSDGRTATLRARGTLLGAVCGGVLIALSVAVVLAVFTSERAFWVLSFVPLAFLAGTWLAATITGVKVSDSGLTVVQPFQKTHYSWSSIDRVDMFKQSRWFSTTDEPGQTVAALILQDGGVVKLRGLRTPWRSEPDYQLVSSINEAVRSHKTSG